MSNLDNMYTSCPGLMSDGRAQRTDYKSHNETFKLEKGSLETSYDFREKLQASGLRDLEAGVRFNMCGVVPAGDVKLDPTINLNINKTGSYLDAFAPLSKASFFAPIVVAQQVAQQVAPVATTQVVMMQPVPTTQAVILPTLNAPVPTTQAMMMAPVPTTQAMSMMIAPASTTQAMMMAPVPTTMVA